jgi:hypothetical protein
MKQRKNTSYTVGINWENFWYIGLSIPVLAILCESVLSIVGVETGFVLSKPYIFLVALMVYSLTLFFLLSIIIGYRILASIFIFIFMLSFSGIVTILLLWMYNPQNIGLGN